MKGIDVMEVRIGKKGRMVVSVEVTPRLERLRAEIGRLFAMKKRLPKLVARGRISVRESDRRHHDIEIRLKSLQLEMKWEAEKAASKRIREIAKHSPKAQGQVWGQVFGPIVSGGLPGLGKRH
jgi:hypothetical protein